MNLQKLRIGLPLLASMFMLQSKAQTKTQLSVADAVSNLYNAMVTVDSTNLYRSSDKGLTFGHSSGKIQNQQEFVASFTTGASVFTKMDVQNEQISVFGNTAIDRHVLDADTNDKGVAGHVHLNIVLVFQKQLNKWILIARQAYK